MKARKKRAGQSPDEIKAIFKGFAERWNRTLDTWLEQIEEEAQTIVDSPDSSARERQLAKQILIDGRIMRTSTYPEYFAMRIGMRFQLLHDLPALLVGSKLRDWLVWRGEPVRLIHKHDGRILRHVGSDDEGDAGPLKSVPRIALKRLNDSLRDQGIPWIIHINRRTGHFTVDAPREHRD